MIAVIIATALVSGIFGLLVGFGASTKQKVAEGLRKAGLNKDTAKLYGRAIKLMRRLDATADLDGAYAGDVLSPETKKQVSEWLADYRKGLDRL